MSGDLVAFLRASGCLGAAVLAMCAGGGWVHGQAAVELGALIFIPLTLSALWWLLTAASLAAS